MKQISVVRRPALALFLVALGAFLIPSAVAQARLPRALVQDSSNMFRVKPPLISYTGDGTGFLGGSDGAVNRDPIFYPSDYRDFVHNFGHLQWRKWTHREGYARGVAWLNNCAPSCAEGTFHAHRARVRLTRLRHGHYTRMKIRYRWGGGLRTDRRVLQHGPSYWFWLPTF